MAIGQTVRATQRSTRQSPYKMRLVIDEIRGKSVNDALAYLQFSKKHAAKQIEKTLRSAVANAEHQSREGNVSLDVDELYIARAVVNDCPGPSGTSTCRPVCPEVFGYPRSPTRASHSRSVVAKMIAFCNEDFFTSKSIVKKSQSSRVGSRLAITWMGIAPKLATYTRLSRFLSKKPCVSALLECSSVTVSSHSGAPGGTFHWKNDLPFTPSG